MWIFGIRTAESGSDGKRDLNDSFSSLLLQQFVDRETVWVFVLAQESPQSSRDQKTKTSLLTQMYTENCSRLSYEKVMRHLFLCWFASTQ